MLYFAYFMKLDTVWLLLFISKFYDNAISSSVLYFCMFCSYNLLQRKLKYNYFQNDKFGTSLVAQWLRIHLPMQGTRVWYLVREDPICHGATKPMHHNYWGPCTETTEARAHVPQLLSLSAATTDAHTPRARALQLEKPMHHNKE